MSQWERNAAWLAGSLFSLSERGFVCPTSERPVCLWQRHTERTSSDFRDGLLNVVAGQGMIDEPIRPCPFVCGFPEFSSKSVFFFLTPK